MRKSLLAVVPMLAVAAILDVHAPARLVATDTLVINGGQPVLVGTRVLNRHGWPAWPAPKPRYTVEPAMVAEATPHDGVRCKTKGDATLTIAEGDLAARVLVRCRPIRDASSPGEAIDLDLHEPAREYAIHATGTDGQPVTLLRGELTIRDTAVARLEGMRVIPRAVGRTLIEASFSGGAGFRVPVIVTERITDTTVHIEARGAYRVQVEPDYYEVHLDAAMAGGSPVLVLGALNSNCARGRDGPQHYYCIMRDSSGFLVVNTGGARAAGRLRIRRFPLR